MRLVEKLCWRALPDLVLGIHFGIRASVAEDAVEGCRLQSFLRKLRPEEEVVTTHFFLLPACSH
jgi:hypothetical protein